METNTVGGLPSAMIEAQTDFSMLESEDTRGKMPLKVKKDKRMQSQLKQDQSVMGTNDSSIVSKRSVERIYYSGPHVYRYFVEKPKKRSPLINRGYWFRMFAIETVVRRFLDDYTGKRRVVLNLGCGYDALPFQLLISDRRLCQATTFVDIDYPSLMQTKVKVVNETEALRSVLDMHLGSAHAPEVLLRSDHYIAVGCDLREIERLQHLLDAELELSNCSFLILAEVSITYMETVAADALIAFAAKLDDARFCLLEQYLPAGSEHPFAQRMVRHFKALNTPLQSIHTYPTLEDQENRFLNLGWTFVTARSLWDLWSDNRFIPSSTRTSLQSVEPFDEWEEYTLFASHYFLLIASNVLKAGTVTKLIDISALKHMEAAYNPGGAARVVLDMIVTDPRQSGMSPSDYTQDRKKVRAFGVLFQSEENAFCHHGGYSGQGRLNTSDIYLNKENAQTSATAPPFTMEPRMNHTATLISRSNGLLNFDCLLVGGRTAPDHPLSDCWYRQDNVWEQVEDLPRPLYRHCASQVNDQFGQTAVLIYGGRSTDGVVSNEWFLWRRFGGWTSLSCNDKTLKPRFAASITSDCTNKGILLGGMSEDGIVLIDFWEWSINFDAEIPSVDVTPVVSADFEYPKDLYVLCRAGASLTRSPTHTYIVGGISRLGVLPRGYDIVRISNIGVLRWCPVTVAPTEWPLRILVGHSSIWDRDSLVVVGGGAVCFSFGYHAHIGSCRILIHEGPSSFVNGIDKVSDHEPWHCLNRPQGLREMESFPMKKLKSNNKGYAKENGASETSQSPMFVSRERLLTSSKPKVSFEQLVSKMQPVLIESLNIGPCCSIWTLEYLKLRIGVDRQVNVHQSESPAMSFQERNFRYVKKPFEEFIDDIASGKLQYLRSLSKSDPVNSTANFTSDFASISEDFSLPPPLQLVTDNFHSSVLRISGPVAMWLHYDVMANVLCQIRGSKRLLLYPPSDILHLQIPHGESSSSINVFDSSSSGQKRLEGTHPREVILRPGDVLFIPPLWAHATCPTDAISVSVNVFFRNLQTGYAAGRDVYGNRDVQAYEDGRRDIQKITKRFANLPPEMARFYLERLGKELEELMPKGD